MVLQQTIVEILHLLLIVIIRHNHGVIIKGIQVVVNFILVKTMFIGNMIANNIIVVVISVIVRKKIVGA